MLRFLALAILTMGLLAVACGDDGGSTNSATATTIDEGSSPPPTTEKSVFDVQVGDCLVLPIFGADEALYLEDVETIDCSELHDYEVLALFDAPDGPFPGEDVFFNLGVERCPSGTSSHIFPTQLSWDLDGDRVIACVLESVFDLQVGDCLNFVSDAVELVACTTAHDAEVTDIFDMLGSIYPGDDAISDFGDANCPNATDSILQPTRDTWELTDDREFICLDE